MDFFINVDKIDTMNLRIFHELTTTQVTKLQFLQHLKLLPTKSSDDQSCKKNATNGTLPIEEKRQMKV